VVGIARSLGIILPAILLGLDLCSSQHPHTATRASIYS
jgi:hypothetical protein